MQRQISKLTNLLIFVSLGTVFTTSTVAVEKFRTSDFDEGHQIWFEAEDYDERNPIKTTITI